MPTLLLYISLMGMVFGVACMGSIFVKKYRALRLLDLESSQTLREKKMRNRILEDRMHRVVEGQIMRALHLLFAPLRLLQEVFRRMAGKLVALERRYRRTSVANRVSDDELRVLLGDAERALRESRFQVAEERLIELVSAAPKYAPAYDLLAQVYAEKKEWKEAIESLVCSLKIKPQVPESHFFLGTLYEEVRYVEKAFQAYAEALIQAPRNPKYLDAYLACALDLGKQKEAAIALQTLREVNPENAKIEMFSLALENLSKTK